MPRPATALLLASTDLTPGGEEGLAMPGGGARERGGSTERGGVGGVRAQVVRQGSFVESRVWGHTEMELKLLKEPSLSSRSSEYSSSPTDGSHMSRQTAQVASIV